MEVRVRETSKYDLPMRLIEVQGSLPFEAYCETVGFIVSVFDCIDDDLHPVFSTPEAFQEPDTIAYSKFAIVVDFFCKSLLSPIFQGGSKRAFFRSFLTRRCLLFGVFRLDSLGIISSVESHCLKDFSLEWFQICILFEQYTVGFMRIPTMWPTSLGMVTQFDRNMQAIKFRGYHSKILISDTEKIKICVWYMKLSCHENVE